MTKEKTSLQCAQEIADTFQPMDLPGNHYVYVFTGKAELSHVEYTEVDGEQFQSNWVYTADFSFANEVCYAGQGENGRMYENDQWRKIVAPKENRLKVKTNLSRFDSELLERLLIAKLGRISDPDFDNGVLVNIAKGGPGSPCTFRSELEKFNRSKASRKADIVAMKADKTIIAQNYAKALASELDINAGTISSVLTGHLKGAYSRSHNCYLYFCRVEDYDSFVFPQHSKPYRRSVQLSKRLITAININTGDICSGTASEISAYASLGDSGHLHKICRGQKKSIRGWICQYADESEERFNASRTDPETLRSCVLY